MSIWLHFVLRVFGVVVNSILHLGQDEVNSFFICCTSYYNLPVTPAQLDEVEISDLKNTPLILLSSPDQQETERSFYANDLGFTSEIYFTEFIDDALMQVIQGKGFMPIEGSGESGTYSAIGSYLPNAQVLDGMAIQGKTAQEFNSDTQQSVSDWLDGLGF